MKHKLKALALLSLILLIGCEGKPVGDEIVTETQVCKTTWEYKWVWSLFEDSGFKLVPVVTCVEK